MPTSTDSEWLKTIKLVGLHSPLLQMNGDSPLIVSFWMTD